MRSNLSPTEEYIAPALRGGWVPRALPRIYLVGTMRGRARWGRFFAARTKNPWVAGLLVPRARRACLAKPSRRPLMGPLGRRAGPDELAPIAFGAQRHRQSSRSRPRRDRSRQRPHRCPEVLGRCARHPRGECRRDRELPAISSSLIASASSKISTGSHRRSITGSQASERASRIVCGKFWRRSSTA